VDVALTLQRAVPMAGNGRTNVLNKLFVFWISSVQPLVW